MKVVADTWCRRRAASPLLLSEPVAVGLLRPNVVGIGEPSDLRLAQSIDAHQLAGRLLSGRRRSHAGLRDHGQRHECPRCPRAAKEALSGNDRREKVTTCMIHEQ